MDISKQCRDLDRTPEQELEIAIQGLRPDIKKQVLLREPATLADVRRVAILTESVSSPTTASVCPVSKSNDISDLRELIQKQQDDIKTLTSLVNKRPSQHQDKPSKRHKTNRECQKCGRFHSDNQCPAHGQKCNYCRKLNHFAKMCFSKKSDDKKSSSASRSANVHVSSTNA